jgi:peptidoglycan/xylan/chitin deacetylase (PgdA/CDA1 family)
VRLPILAYHSISADPGPAIAALTVRPERFARHLDLIVAGGGTALTVSDATARIERGEALPARTVVLTFDDGFEDNLRVAAPLLRSRGLPATVYLATGLLPGCPDPVADPGVVLGPMLAWDRLGELEAAGFEVGAHSHSHPQLDLLPRAQASAEIRRSKGLLEDALGHTVATFAYPHGYATRWLREEARRCGFRSACGVGNAFSHERDLRWQLARLTVGATTTDGQIWAWLDGSGARLSGRRERVRTKAWRATRRARALPFSPIPYRP